MEKKDTNREGYSYWFPQINSPKANMECNCCRRHISELKPFGKAGDPCVGDFDGAFLIKKYRPAGPYNRESGAAWAEAAKHFAEIGEKGKDPLEWMIQKYGKEKGEYLYWVNMAYGQTGSSWECRDCAVLDEDEFFEKIRLRCAKEN